MRGERGAAADDHRPRRAGLGLRDRLRDVRRVVERLRRPCQELRALWAHRSVRADPRRVVRRHVWFVRASWLIMAATVLSYLDQLFNPAERQAVRSLLDRLDGADRHGAIALFGSLFLEWASRVRGNRHLEVKAVRRAFSFGSAALSLLALCCAGVAAGAATAGVCALRRARARRRPARVAAAPLEVELGAADAWESAPRPESSPNRVCHTRLLGVPLRFAPCAVCAITFLASLLIYFTSADDFFFLFVAFGQVVETGSFRSCGPVAFFCVFYCTFEAAAALRQARHDAELNLSTCTVVRGGATRRVRWHEVALGARVRLTGGETPPCDLLVARVHGALRASEKDLTGESKPVAKQVVSALGAGEWPARVRARLVPADDAVDLHVDGGVARLDASHQLFRGTTVVLSPTDAAAPFVEGVAVRVAHECKMYRECAAASQPLSILYERMKRIGLTLVVLLLLLSYDNTLAVFATANSGGKSFGKVFFGQLIYLNTLVPMSVKQLVMVACSVQAVVWFAASGTPVNHWQAVARLGEVATEGAAAVLTDKTGTLTCNRMRTHVVVRRLRAADACTTWAVFTDRRPDRQLGSEGPAAEPPDARAAAGGGAAVGARGMNGAGADAPSGGAGRRASITLLPDEPFPDHVAERDDDPFRACCFTWAAVTGELPAGRREKAAVGEAEEASFLCRVPGELLTNAPDGMGGAEVAFALRHHGGGSGSPSRTEHHVPIIALLPLSKRLRAKGALVAGRLGDGLPRGGAARAIDIGGACTLVAQGAGSFFKAAHAPNREVVDLLEGSTTTGMLARSFAWRGAVRIWFHGERELSAAEAEAAVRAMRSAACEAEREAALEALYRGTVITQASAMEDPYQTEVPQCISLLREEGYRLMMVTGDSDSAAEGIAYATGLALRGERPLVRVSAETADELLECVRMLMPSAPLGEFCYLFGASSAATLQRAAATADAAHAGDDPAGPLATRAFGALRRRAIGPAAGAPSISSPGSPSAVEEAKARALVDGVAQLFSTGAHTAVWAQIPVDQKPFIAHFVQRHARLRVLSIGDGVNDVGMLRTSHASVGIRGAESLLAARAAMFRADEWRALSPMLLRQAPRAMALLATTMKWVYYKHAMTACALEAWMVHHNYATWRDPTDPIYAVFFNTVVFLSALAYATQDTVADPSTLRRKDLFHVSSISRWWLSGAVHGFLIGSALVLFFGPAGAATLAPTPRPLLDGEAGLGPTVEERRELGVRLLCVQAIVLSARLAAATNAWIRPRDVGATASNGCGAPSPSALRRSASAEPLLADADADVDLESCPPDEVDDEAVAAWTCLLQWPLRACHTRVGHFVPCLAFTAFLTRWTRVPTLPVALVGAALAALCALSDALVFPRVGPLRYSAGIALSAALKPARMILFRRRAQVVAVLGADGANPLSVHVKST